MRKAATTNFSQEEVSPIVCSESHMDTVQETLWSNDALGLSKLRLE